jgi:predicted dehydrogenase
MAKPIRVGIFGAGNFANNQHLPNLSRVDNVEIVAICDVNEQAARDTAGRFDIPHVYTDGHEMLDKEPMDAMWSIVPAFARTDVEATAASKGIHLFSEKPQALEMSVARRIDEAVRKAGVLSAVCFRERYRPIFQEAKRRLEGKEVTHIRFQSIRDIPDVRDKRTWHGVFEKGASAFFDWGPHAVDYARFASGLDVTTAQGYLKHDPEQHRSPTSASFNFLMSNGATMTLAFISVTPVVPPDEPYFLFYYEGGYLAIHGYNYIEVNGEKVFEGEDFNPWFELDRRFCEAVRSGDDSDLLNDYHDGLYSLGPILAAWESSRQGGQPIDVNDYVEKA